MRHRKRKSERHTSRNHDFMLVSQVLIFPEEQKRKSLHKKIFISIFMSFSYSQFGNPNVAPGDYDVKLSRCFVLSKRRFY